MIKGRDCTRFLIVVCLSFGLPLSLCAQPFVDPIQIRYTYGVKNGEATPFTHLWIGSDIPLKLKERTYLVLSPYYEQWHLDLDKSQTIYPKVQSFAFPVGLIMPIASSKWSVTVLPILRSNGEKLFDRNTIQFGGVSFASYARKPFQKFRFGVYVNTEFFGFFIWPLLGVDWRIDAKNYVFGLLPGRFTYEHQWSKRWFGGVTFRALTNSYRLSSGNFIRLDDNQVSLYLDYYLAKHVCLTLEPGYGVFRKIRTGTQGSDYTSIVKWGDGPFIKLSGSYRIRL